MTPDLHPIDVERTLQQLWGDATPDAEFVDRLEVRLLAAYPAASARATLRPGRPGRLRWALAAAIALAAIVLLIVGPERAWAQIERWLGYVPGIGFVEHLDQARTLAAPVSQTRNGLTLRVVQFVALPDRTEIVLAVDGFDPGRFQPDALERENPSVTLTGPDGAALELRSANLISGRMHYLFGPLSAETDTATLRLSFLPLVPKALAAGPWDLVLTFAHLTSTSIDALPTPYAPPDVVTVHQGVRVSVADVVEAVDETRIRLRLNWADAQWGTLLGQNYGGGYWAGMLPELIDDIGHRYGPPPRGNSSVALTVLTAPEGSPTPAPEFHDEIVDLAYAPLSGMAQAYTLTINSLTFQVPVSNAVTFDFGPAPRLHQVLVLDQAFTAAGVSARFERAAWTELGQNAGGGIGLELDVSVTNPDDRRLLRLDAFVDGLDLDDARAFSFGASAYGPNGIRLIVPWPAGRPLPVGAITVRLDTATLEVQGPWRLAWEPPERTPDRSAPIVLRPTDASATDQGYTLKVETVTLTDRLSTVSLSLANAPDPVDLPAWSLSFAQILDARRDPLLADDGIIPEGFDQPGALLVSGGPAQFLTSQLIVSISALTVIRPAAGQMEVQVPLDARASSTAGVDSWPVDIDFELSGQRIHYTTATLIDSGFELRVQLSRFDAVSLNWFYAAPTPVWSRVDGPRGQVAPFNKPEDYAAGMFAVAQPGASSPSAAMTFPVAVDPDTGDVLAGTYTLTLEGLRVVVPGHWEIPIDLGEPRAP